MYIIEMAFDNNMRASLVMHHWAVIAVYLWGNVVLYILNHGYGVYALRALYSFLVYILTEQSVFFEMLLYYRNVTWPCFYEISAWYYVLSRAVISCMCVWTWWGMYDVVFKMSEHNSFMVYGLWLFLPVGTLIFVLTQWTTVQSLFGIAAKVRQRRRELRQACSPLPTFLKEAAGRVQRWCAIRAACHHIGS